MKQLYSILEEWADKVKPKWHPKEGLFTGDNPQEIADYLLKHSKDRGQAMRRLVFYMNRAGDDLPNKTVLNKVKKILSESLLDNDFTGPSNAEIIAGHVVGDKWKHYTPKRLRTDWDWYIADDNPGIYSNIEAFIKNNCKCVSSYTAKKHYENKEHVAQFNGDFLNINCWVNGDCAQINFSACYYPNDERRTAMHAHFGSKEVRNGNDIKFTIGSGPYYLIDNDIFKKILTMYEYIKKVAK